MSNYNFIVTEEMQMEIEDAIFSGTQEEKYDDLVDTFVRQQYKERNVEAILNNYLDNPSVEKYNEAFRELQNYRKACKLYAKELLEMN